MSETSSSFDDQTNLLSKISGVPPIKELPDADSDYFSDISSQDRKKIIRIFDACVKQNDYAGSHPNLEMTMGLGALDYADSRYPTKWKDYFYAAKNMPRPVVTNAENNEPESKNDMVNIPFAAELPNSDSEYFQDISSADRERLIRIFDDCIKQDAYAKSHPNLKMQSGLGALEYLDPRYPTKWKDYYYAVKKINRPEINVAQAEYDEMKQNRENAPRFLKELVPVEITAESLIQNYLASKKSEEVRIPDFLRKMFEKEPLNPETNNQKEPLNPETNNQKEPLNPETNNQMEETVGSTLTLIKSKLAHLFHKKPIENPVHAQKL